MQDDTENSEFRGRASAAECKYRCRTPRHRKYPLADYATPYEKLKSLPEAEKYLKPGVSWAQLDKAAKMMSDTESARKLVVAKAKLLRACKVESPVPPRFS